MKKAVRQRNPPNVSTTPIIAKNYKNVEERRICFDE